MQPSVSPCNPIKMWPKWDHYNHGSPESISAGVNYHRAARVHEQSCTLSLIETAPPSKLSFLTTAMLCLMDLIKHQCPLFPKCSSTCFQRKSSPEGSRVSCDSARVGTKILFHVTLNVCIRNMMHEMSHYPLSEILDILRSFGSNLK